MRGSVFLSWPTVNNCDLSMSAREQMLARMGNAQKIENAQKKKMHTISPWKRRQFSVPLTPSVKSMPIEETH